MSQEALKKIAQTLHQAKIPYMIIGGQAVLYYGYPRLTQDIDITLALAPHEIDILLNALPSSFQPIPHHASEFARQTWVLPTLHQPTQTRIDLIFSATVFEQKAIESASTVMVEQVPICYISPEDLIIQKIISGRAVDLEDARSIFSIQKQKIDASKIDGTLKRISQETEQPQWLQCWDEIKKFKG